MRIEPTDCPTRPIKNKEDARKLFKDFLNNPYFKKYVMVDGIGAGFDGWARYLLDSTWDL